MERAGQRFRTSVGRTMVNITEVASLDLPLERNEKVMIWVF
jgi:hypothetical protein